ncbi:unnamed protein product, partial [Ilex paraguariensis]
MGKQAYSPKEEGKQKTGILKKGQDLKGKEKEWQKVTRKGGPKVTVEEGHQVPNSLLYPNGLSEGVIAANKFNVLNGDHSGKDVGEEENAEMENHNGTPIIENSTTGGLEAKEKEDLSLSTSNHEGIQGVGVENEMSSNAGSPSRSFEGMKVYEVIGTPSQTQGTGPDEVQQT